MQLDNDLHELNTFVNEEFSDILRLYGIQKMPEKALDSQTNGILRRKRIYSKLITKQDKFRVKVEWAYFTMPHNWLWKIFHKRVWYHVKKRIEEEQQNQLQEQLPEVESEQPQVVSPVVVRQVDLSAMSYPSTIQQQ